MLAYFRFQFVFFQKKSFILLRLFVILRKNDEKKKSIQKVWTKASQQNASTSATLKLHPLAETKLFGRLILVRSIGGGAGGSGEAGHRQQLRHSVQRRVHGGLGEFFSGRSLERCGEGFLGVSRGQELQEDTQKKKKHSR